MWSFRPTTRRPTSSPLTRDCQTYWTGWIWIGSSSSASIPPSIVTEELILALRQDDPRVKMLRFSRRFGQPMATLAGMQAATGDAVVVIDCDLQDPPELIPELVGRWREGYDVVHAERRTRPARPSPSASCRRSGIA